MSKTSNIHPFTKWAKSRLDEMDASLAVFETKVDTVEAKSRKRADAAIADMKTRRDAFKAEVEETHERDVKALAQASDKLEAEWEAFEDDVEVYWDNVADQTKESRPHSRRGSMPSKRPGLKRRRR